MAPIKGSDYCPKIGKELKSGGFWRDCVSELFATFFLVVAQLMLLQNWQPAASSSPQALAVQVAVGMTFVGASVGYGLGDFGGAHMNPAVTMAMMIRGEVTIVKGIFYWAVQIAGGILAAFFVYAISPTTQVTDSKLGNTLLNTDVLWWQGLLIEATITAMLCLAALGTANISRKGYIILPSVPVGLALGLGLFLALNSTGASMNPARSLGPCVVGKVMMNWDECMPYHWIYWVGPFIGATIAAILYWVFDSVDKPKTPQPQETQQTEPNPYASNAWAYNSLTKQQPQPVQQPQQPTTVMVPMSTTNYASPYVFQQNV